MGGGLESRCVDRVYGADCAVHGETLRFFVQHVSHVENRSHLYLQLAVE